VKQAEARVGHIDLAMAPERVIAAEDQTLPGVYTPVYT